MIRRTPLRRVSLKRQKALREYTKLRRKFLDKNRVCEVCKNSPSFDIHHTKGRGLNLLVTDTWKAVCRDCHERIHRNPSWAREQGYLARATAGAA